jgi:hypothetical protein
MGGYMAVGPYGSTAGGAPVSYLGPATAGAGAYE